MRTRARPKKVIDQKIFEGLCEIQCTEEEICSVFEIDEMTLNRFCRQTYGKTFKDVFKEKRLGGRTSLRRKQWNLAETNPTMAIWLGKQYLGQKDKVEEETTLEAVVKNIQTLADIVTNVAPNRNIEDLE